MRTGLTGFFNGTNGLMVSMMAGSDDFNAGWTLVKEKEMMDVNQREKEMETGMEMEMELGKRRSFWIGG